MKPITVSNSVTDTGRARDTDLQSKPDYGLRANLAQLLATMVQSMLLLNVGMELAIFTVVIGSDYKNPNAEFELTDTQSSWFGSILYLCQPLGSTVSGYAQTRLGNRSCVVLACVPSVLGWYVLRHAHSVDTLYLATVMMGLGLGFNDGPAYSYVGEACEPRLRGVMSCMVNTACLVGIMTTYSTGFVCHWRTVALMNVFCPITCLLLVSLIPESPIWLITKGKNRKAMDAICWLRGWVEPSLVAAEYQELLDYYKISVEQGKQNNKAKRWFSAFGWIKDPSVYRPLRLACLYYAFTLISCLTPCRPYIVQLMYESGVKDTHSTSIALMLFGFTQLSGSVVLMLIVRRLGKRLMTLTTLAVNAFALLAFGAYIACTGNGLLESRAFVPMFLFSVIMFSGAMGMLTVPWTLVSEIYPNKAKGFACSLTTAIFYVLTFSTTKVYLTVQNALGLTTTLLASAALSCVGFVYLYRSMPETENKTLLEIEAFFVPKKNRPPSETQLPGRSLSSYRSK